MKTTRFFNIELTFQDGDPKLSRSVIEAFLQDFFYLGDLKGRELADRIGTMTLFNKRIDNTTGKNGWSKDFVVVNLLK